MVQSTKVPTRYYFINLVSQSLTNKWYAVSFLYKKDEWREREREREKERERERERGERREREEREGEIIS